MEPRRKTSMLRRLRRFLNWWRSLPNTASISPIAQLMPSSRFKRPTWRPTILWNSWPLCWRVTSTAQIRSSSISLNAGTWELRSSLQMWMKAGEISRSSTERSVSVLLQSKTSEREPSNRSSRKEKWVVIIAHFSIFVDAWICDASISGSLRV